MKILQSTKYLQSMLESAAADCTAAHYTGPHDNLIFNYDDYKEKYQWRKCRQFKVPNKQTNIILLCFRHKREIRKSDYKKRRETEKLQEKNALGSNTE